MTGEDPDKGALAFEQAPMAVAVIASPKPSDKIPVIEQTFSAGIVALSLVNAALAAGWGASWMTGWAGLRPRARRGLPRPRADELVLASSTSAAARPRRRTGRGRTCRR